MPRVDNPGHRAPSQAQVDLVEKNKAVESKTKQAAEEDPPADFDGAIALMKTLLSSEPGTPTPWFSSGLAYVGKQMYTEAIDALKQVTELPQLPGAHSSWVSAIASSMICPRRFPRSRRAGARSQNATPPTTPG